MIKNKIKYFIILLVCSFLTISISYAKKSSKKKNTKDKKRSAGSKKHRRNNSVQFQTQNLTSLEESKETIQKQPNISELQNIKTENKIEEEVKKEKQDENVELVTKIDNNPLNISSNKDKENQIDVKKLYPKEWETFKLCMKRGCSAGDDQPPNVECYKTSQLEEQFSTCEKKIEDKKVRKLLKEYFVDPFLEEEKKAFCTSQENDGLHGIWEEKGTKGEEGIILKKGRCKLQVTYKRNAITRRCLKPKELPSQEVKKFWYVENTYFCSGKDTFGVSPEYEDTPQCTANIVQMTMGGVEMGMGVLQGTIAGVMAAASASKKVKIKQKEEVDDGQGGTKPKTVEKEIEIDDVKQYYKEEVDEKTGEKRTVFDTKNSDGVSENDVKSLKSKKISEGVITGISTGLGGTMSGIGKMVTADMLMREKGPLIRGTCTLSNGKIFKENDAPIKLTW